MQRSPDAVQKQQLHQACLATALVESGKEVPSAFVGHSRGALVAEYVAGLLDDDSFVRLVELTRKVQLEASDGQEFGLVAVQAPFKARCVPPMFELACLNHDKQFVMVGLRAYIEQFAAMDPRGRAVAIPVDGPYHSRKHLECQKQRFMKELRENPLHRGTDRGVTYYSSVTGRRATDVTEAEYQWEAVAGTVRFQPLIPHLRNSEMLEFGQSPMLTRLCGKQTRGECVY